MYIILAVRYICLLQKAQIVKLEKLIQKVNRSSCSNNWTTFCRLNRKWIFLCRMIEEYSRYCTPFLCIVYPFYITVQCYLLYIIAFVNIPSSQVATLYLAVLQCNLFLFVLTHECAVIVKKNGSFERLTREFIFKYHLQKMTTNNGVFTNQDKYQLVKVDLFLGNKRLHRYVFKLFAYFRITSKMYYLVNINFFNF